MFNVPIGGGRPTGLPPSRGALTRLKSIKGSPGRSELQRCHPRDVCARWRCATLPAGRAGGYPTNPSDRDGSGEHAFGGPDGRMAGGKPRSALCCATWRLDIDDAAKRLETIQCIDGAATRRCSPKFASAASPMALSAGPHRARWDWAAPFPPGFVSAAPPPFNIVISQPWPGPTKPDVLGRRPARRATIRCRSP